MATLAEVKGYYKEVKKRIDGYIVSTIPATEAQLQGKDGDDKIFYYFENLEALEKLVAQGKNNGEDFVITSYVLLEGETVDTI